MKKIHTIHGFLGLDSDWDYLKMDQIVSHDLFKDPLIPQANDFFGWAKRFNDHVNTDDSFIMGYSLGGRLALHALLDNPSKWAGAVIVSSHPGFQTEDEKKQRILNDYKWAERFENEPWEQLMKDWQGQTVFANIPHPLKRNESEFDRKQLAHLLRSCSRGFQTNLIGSIQKVDKPILWVCGELDQVYTKSSEEISFSHPKSKIVVVKDAGHRVPWEQPKPFAHLVNQFIKEIS
jgi:2-succinyl-6-hydroxy-2,4-cyclohexadiene-1-carboxylate synthase